MSSFNQRGCVGCGGPLDGLLCRRCTCEWCGNNLRNGFCSICDSGAGNSFVYDPNPNSFNDPPNFFNHSPQPKFELYSCELCRNDSHYGFDCPPRFSLVYDQEPSYNQNFGDNYFPQNSLRFSQQYICCKYCGGPHESLQCQPRNQNYFEPNPCYNSNSYGFDQPTQKSIDHQPPKEMNTQDTKIQEHLREMKIMMHEIQQIKLINMLKDFQPKIDQDTYTPEPLTQRSNVICYDDDDDEESTSQLPPSIAIMTSLPVLPPDLVLIPSESEDISDNDSECDLPFCDDSPPLDVLGGNSVTFSNPFSDSNDDFTSSNDESLPKEDVQEENFKIYSNPLFEFDEEYISTNINPLYNEVLEEIDRENSLLAIDDPFLLDIPPSGSKLVSLEEVENFDPSLSLIRSGMMTRVADIPSLELNEDECFDLGGGEIDVDIPPDFEDDYYNSEGDIIYLESLLINDTIPNLPPEVFLDHDPKSLNDEPNIDNLKIKENVRFTFEDRHYLSLTFVIIIFLPFLTYHVNSPLLLSSESEDTIFYPGISAYSFYSLEPVASHQNETFMCFNVYPNILNESPMEIFSSNCFCPKDKGIRGEIVPDYEDSHARGFVHRSLELQSLACLYLGIRYPRSY
ncbi:hypothetical protein Tco_0567849 [Tanacetum coccineum]